MKDVYYIVAAFDNVT